MMTNEEMFEANRAAPGKFTKQKLIDIRNELLFEISKWFHEIHETSKPKWLSYFADEVLQSSDTIISFNWDLELDKAIFGDDLSPESYGFGDNISKPTLLKPHGSLNWFSDTPSERLNRNKTFNLSRRSGENVRVFRKFRGPKSNHGRIYMPLVMPPTFTKNFGNSLYPSIWRKSVSAISKAKKVCFVGYSLAASDYHARFILSCGFHNQLDGEILGPRQRSSPTDASKVEIVDPSKNTRQRIRGVLRPEHKSITTNHAKKAANWLRIIQSRKS